MRCFEYACQFISRYHGDIFTSTPLNDNYFSVFCYLIQ